MDDRTDPRPPRPLLEAVGLTVRFGKVTALDGLDLTAAAGEVLALLGPNGAGKTTFVRSVATLLRPSAGVLRVAGHDVGRAPAAVRRVIGLAGQFAAVEPVMTGRENLEMTARLFWHGRAAGRRAAAAVIDRLGLAAVADRRAGTYSGGERRRLDHGASLVGGPRLLLLDEPTTGLDPAARRDVWTAVRALVEAGTDVLLTTHYLDEADELADRVVVIDRGRTVAAGTPAALKHSVGRDVIELVLDDPARLESAGAILARAASAPVRLDRAARRASVTLTTTVAKGGAPGELVGVVDALAAAGIGVEEIGLRRPTLDEVFLTLTGEDRTKARAR